MIGRNKAALLVFSSYLMLRRIKVDEGISEAGSAEGQYSIYRC